MQRQDDEKRLADVAANLSRLCERRCEPCYSDFLSEGEQMLVQRALFSGGGTRFMFWGGFEAAQRAMLCVYPEFCEPSESDFPLEALSVSFRSSAGLSHRDFLGALMGLGLKRGVIGDIVISGGAATCFVKSELAPYIRAQLEKVGREGVTFTEKGADLSKAAQQLSERQCTVSSLRLDAFVSECSGLSRAKAQQAVKGGLVAVNALVVCSVDRRIENGDKISVRGFGKFVVGFDGSMSKKGKYRVTVSKYL